MKHLFYLIKIFKIFYWNFVYGHEISFNITLEPGVVIKAHGKLVIEQRCTLSRGVILDPAGGKIMIAENTFIGPYSVIYGHGSCVIGRDCLLASGTKIIPANHVYADKLTPMTYQGLKLYNICIEENCWLGFDCVLVGGAHVEKGCILRPKSMVSKRLEEYGIYNGNNIIGPRNA